MKPLIDTLRAHQSLSEHQVESAVIGLTGNEFPDQAKADFLTALAAKGESPAEIAAFAKAFLRRSIDPEIGPLPPNTILLDVCGTGGDKLGLFNVSTTVAFVCAAAGVAVVKHGNRGITSRSGGADVLEALGVAIDLTPPKTAACLAATHFLFLFAQRYHPAFKSVASVRRQLGEQGIVTIFNILGPLLNPAQPTHQLCGVYRPDFLLTYCEVLRLLGRREAVVIAGAKGDGTFGMDEVSLLGPTRYARLKNGEIEEGEFAPEDFDAAPVSLEELKGGDAAANAKILIGLLSGEIGGGKREMVEVNAGLALYLSGKADTPRAGRHLASEIIDSRRAMETLERVRQFR